MTDLLYHIRMGTGYALSVNDADRNPGSQLILNDSSRRDPDQYWSLIFNPSTQASILFHPGTGLYAAPTSLDNGAPVVLFALPSTLPGNLSFDSAQTWQVVGTPPYAVRMAANENRNLNASGGSWGAGTPIIIYHWGGGADNEVWNLTLRA